jgi:hypothetical protein
MRPDAQHLEDLPPRIAGEKAEFFQRNSIGVGIEPAWCGEEHDSLRREDSGELEAASNILISDVGFLVGVFWAVDLEGGR